MSLTRPKSRGIKKKHFEKFLTILFSFLVEHGDLCDGGWSFFNGSCYFLVDYDQTFSQAARTCRLMSLGAHLVNLESMDENEFVASLAPTSDLWIGYTDAAFEGQWRWVSQRGLQKKRYTNWDRGQPDNHRNQDCALIWGWYETAKWDDRECSARKWSVCEKGKTTSDNCLPRSIYEATGHVY